MSRKVMRLEAELERVMREVRSSAGSLIVLMNLVGVLENQLLQAEHDRDMFRVILERKQREREV